jgi:hypothetical protein
VEAEAEVEVEVEVEVEGGPAQGLARVQGRVQVQGRVRVQVQVQVQGLAQAQAQAQVPRAVLAAGLVGAPPVSRGSVLVRPAQRAPLVPWLRARSPLPLRQPIRSGSRQAQSGWAAGLAVRRSTQARPAPQPLGRTQ